MNRRSSAANTSAANVGYEAQLWRMADALRGSMDVAAYKHSCLGLLFLKYLSDAFEERHDWRGAPKTDADDSLGTNRGEALIRVAMAMGPP